MTMHEANPKASLNRRTLLKGVGLAATAAAVQGPEALMARTGSTGESAKTRPGPGVLAGAPVVMIWRNTSDLAQTEQFVDRTSHLQEIAREPDAVYYDAGTVILGYGNGHTGRQPDRTSRPWVGNPRSQLNPSSIVAHVPLDFRRSVHRLSAQTRGQLRVDRGKTGDTASFVDHYGNHFCFHRPLASALGDPLARRFRSILASGGSTAEGRAPVESPIGAVELLVADLDRSARFYSEVLGLRLLSEEPEQRSFDLRTILLVLRPEPVGGLVDLLRRSGRLQANSQVFYVSDIQGSVHELSALGLDSPFGIEERSVGKVATVSDPDGHSWALWQPSDEIEKTGYYPTLSRIAGTANEPS